MKWEGEDKKERYFSEIFEKIYNGLTYSSSYSSSIPSLLSYILINENLFVRSLLLSKHQQVKIKVTNAFF